MSKIQNPVHGICTVCRGAITKYQVWTLTPMMNRVHANQDNCIRELRPSVVKAFLRANPNYQEQGVKRG